MDYSKAQEYSYVTTNKAVLQVSKFKSQTFMQLLSIAATFRKHMIKRTKILIRKEMENKVKIYNATWLLCCTSVRLMFIMAYKDSSIILNFQ